MPPSARSRTALCAVSGTILLPTCCLGPTTTLLRDAILGESMLCLSTASRPARCLPNDVQPAAGQDAPVRHANDAAVHSHLASCWHGNRIQYLHGALVCLTFDSLACDLPRWCCVRPLCGPLAWPAGDCDCRPARFTLLRTAGLLCWSVAPWLSVSCPVTSSDCAQLLWS